MNLSTVPAVALKYTIWSLCKVSTAKPYCQPFSGISNVCLLLHPRSQGLFSSLGGRGREKGPGNEDASFEEQTTADVASLVCDSPYFFPRHNTTVPVSRSCRRLQRNQGWFQHVWNTYSDPRFRKTFRVSRETFIYILSKIEHDLLSSASMNLPEKQPLWIQ